MNRERNDVGRSPQDFANQVAQLSRDFGAIGQSGGMVRKDTDAEHKAHKVLSAAQEHRSLSADQTLMLKMVMPSVKAQWKQLSVGLYKWFKHQGFWPREELKLNPFANSYADADTLAGSRNEPRTIAIPFAEYVRLKKMEKLGLVVTEVAEAMEAVRKDDLANEVEEIADVQVRLLDYMGGFHEAEYLDAPDALGDAFEQKMMKNYSRPFRHGKEF